MSETVAFIIGPSSDSSASLQGAMTLDTVTALYQQAAGFFGDSTGDQDLDLAAVTRVDTSGLALLLEWQAQKNRAGGSLKIRNAPADLLRLASLVDAQDLLNIEGRATANAGHPGASDKNTPE